jgi:uncharacterized protein
MKLSAEYIRLIRTNFATMPIKKAFLFGAYACEDASENSGIDILVGLDYHRGIAFQFIEMQSYFDDTFEKKVDLVSANGLLPNVVSFIEKEKIIIYER